MVAGGWRKLEAFAIEASERRKWEAEQPPQRCPHDGTILQLVEDDRGVLVYHCEMGNYTAEA